MARGLPNRLGLGGSAGISNGSICMGLVWHGAVRWHCACAWEGAWQKPAHLASPVACVWSPTSTQSLISGEKGGEGAGATRQPLQNAAA